MEDVFVGRLMSSPVETVSPDTPAHLAAEKKRIEVRQLDPTDHDGLGVWTCET